LIGLALQALFLFASVLNSANVAPPLWFWLHLVPVVLALILGGAVLGLLALSDTVKALRCGASWRKVTIAVLAGTSSLAYGIWVLASSVFFLGHRHDLVSA
jgi:hypothetical protein